MKNNVKILLALLLPLLFFSCGKELDRIVFNQIETIEKEIFISSNKPLQIWVDLEVDYTGAFSLLYDIKLLKDDEMLYDLVCDAIDVGIRTNSLISKVGNNYTAKYEGKLRFNTKKLDTGIYKLIVTPLVQGNYNELSKYDLILKQ
ncbi:MAG: hypothetical protein GY756_22320 [bacterium]|nr:hypothetical protein [bacterium]